jgi:hypothetical protein
MVFMCKKCGVEPATVRALGLGAFVDLCDLCLAARHPRPAPPPAPPIKPRKPCHVEWWPTAPPAWRRGLVFALRANGVSVRDIANLVGLTDAGVRRYDDIVMNRARRLADRRWGARRARPFYMPARLVTDYLDRIGRGL